MNNQVVENQPKNRKLLDVAVFTVLTLLASVIILIVSVNITF